MPYATLCPNCSYHWTLNEASPRSWKCPKCGSSANDMTVGNLCVCGHSYNDHDRIREVENSLEAATVPGKDATPEYFAKLPMRAQPPNPPIGRCRACDCSIYAYASAE